MNFDSHTLEVILTLNSRLRAVNIFAFFRHRRRYFFSLAQRSQLRKCLSLLPKTCTRSGTRTTTSSNSAQYLLSSTTFRKEETTRSHIQHYSCTDYTMHANLLVAYPVLLVLLTISEGWESLRSMTRL